MTQWLTSIRKELGEDVSRLTVKNRLVEGFENVLNTKLEPGQLTEREKKILKKLVEERKKEDWIFSKDQAYMQLVTNEETRRTKVKGGLIVSEAVHKAGKLIRITLVTGEDAIAGISISGDFFTQPYIGAIEELEAAFIGTVLEEKELNERVNEVFDELGLMLFGATRKDLVAAILKAKIELS
jgi:hypothetical protein